MQQRLSNLLAANGIPVDRVLGGPPSAAVVATYMRTLTGPEQSLATSIINAFDWTPATHDSWESAKPKPVMTDATGLLPASIVPPPAAHGHAASDIVAGTFVPGRLGSGTPDGTKFLRDDSVWIKPPSGGPLTVVSDADQAVANATLVNATDLAFAVTASVLVRFRFFCVFRSTVATVGFKCGLTFPAATLFAATARIPIASDTASMELQGALTSSGDSVVGTAVPAINIDYLAIVEGVLLPSAAGTLQLQFAAETTGATVTLRAGSIGELEVP